MIHIIPSIFVKDGKCIAISENHSCKYSFLKDSPLDLALQFQDVGIKKVQLIDLDGVETDIVKNLHCLSDISSLTKLEVSFGGGVNTDDEIRLAFDYGANKVICSTLRTNEKELFGSWIFTYGRDKIILSVDTVGNKVNAFGESHLDAKQDVLDYIDYFNHFGILYVKCTELTAIESATGPTYDLYNKVKNRFPNLKLIASGGVRTIDDIKRLQEQGLYAVVFGKAFYEGKITLEEIKKLNL